MLTKSKFTNDSWVTGRHNGMYVIGRTFALKGVQYVCIVSELATTTDVPISELTDLKALTISGSRPAEKAPRKQAPTLAEGFMSRLTKAHLN